MVKSSCSTSGYHRTTSVYIFGDIGVRFARSLVFWVVFSTALFVLFHLAIILSILRSTASDYPFGIFELSLFS